MFTQQMDLNSIKIKLTPSSLTPQISSAVDSNFNISVCFKGKIQRLSKVATFCQAQLLKNLMIQRVTLLEVRQNFDENMWALIMKLLEDQEIEIEKVNSIKCIAIASYLQLTPLLNTLRAQILQHSESYNIFELINYAYKYHDDQIFSLCIEHLQKQSYEQLNYSQQDLLNLEIQVFKLILKWHNQFKKKHKTEISYLRINQFIEEFCLANQLNDKQYGELKFQIFDLTVLSSEEYKAIFLPEMNQQNQRKIQKKISLLESVLFSSSNKLKKQHSKSENNQTQSSQIYRKNQDIKKQMLITFLRKRNTELQAQNQFLAQELSKIKKITIENENIHKQMKKDITDLKEEIVKKEGREMQSKRIISEIQPLLIKLQKEIQKKSAEIDRLMQSRKRYMQNKDQQDLKNIEVNQSSSDAGIVQSQFLSANLIHEMFSGSNIPSPLKHFKGPRPKKKNTADNDSQKIKVTQNLITSVGNTLLNEDDEDMVEQKIKYKIFFDQRPRFLSASELVKLSKLFPVDFRKKNLKLIFSRSLKYPSKGEKADIRNRKNLFVLINTENNSHIGGYISSSIPSKQKSAYIPDSESFIFSLTKDMKATIDKNQQNNAIFISDSYLLAFGNDLMISSASISTKSYCFWPSSYHDPNHSDKNSNWFAGNSQFLIKDIEIYEVHDEEMEMVI